MGQIPASLAIERLQDSQFDVVLTDLQMPGMTGFEVCRAIKRNPFTSRIPVLMLAAAALHRGPEWLDGAGAVAVLTTYAWAVMARTGGRLLNLFNRAAQDERLAQPLPQQSPTGEERRIGARHCRHQDPDHRLARTGNRDRTLLHHKIADASQHACTHCARDVHLPSLLRRQASPVVISSAGPPELALPPASGCVRRIRSIRRSDASRGR